MSKFLPHLLLKKKSINEFRNNDFVGSRGGKNTRNDGSEKGIQNEISVSYTDENGKKQTTVHSNIDDATLQRVINEILKKLNN